MASVLMLVAVWLACCPDSTTHAGDPTPRDDSATPDAAKTESARQPAVTSLALHPRGDVLIAGSQLGLQFYSWPDLQPRQQRKTSLAQIHDLIVDDSSQRLLVAGGEPAQAGRLELLDLQEPTRDQSLKLGDDVVYRVRWSVRTSTIVAAGGDGVCHVIDAKSFTKRLEYRGHSRAVLAATLLGSNGREASEKGDSNDLLCLTGGVDMTLRIWNFQTGAASRTLDNHVAPVNDAALRPQPAAAGLAWVASVSEDRTVRLWQPTIGRLVRFARLPSVPRAVVWSSDGERLYVACNDGDVRELSFDTLEVLRTLPGQVGRPHDLVFDSRNSRLALGGQLGVQAVNLSRP